jgi:hypothetical protein
MSTIMIQNYIVGTEQMGPIVSLVQASVFEWNCKNHETAAFVLVVDPCVLILYCEFMCVEGGNQVNFASKSRWEDE